MSKENKNKLLELYTLCAIKKSGVQFKDIKRIVETKMNDKIDYQTLIKVIENLVSARFLEKKNETIYPKYDYENVLSEIACLALEVWGPLQLRDLSHYILNINCFNREKP